MFIKYLLCANKFFETTEVHFLADVVTLEKIVRGRWKSLFWCSPYLESKK